MSALAEEVVGDGPMVPVVVAGAQTNGRSYAALIRPVPCLLADTARNDRIRLRRRR
jgi:hypothetical protein